MILNSSSKVFDFFSKHIANDVEEFWIAALDSRLKVIHFQMLFRGTADSCLTHPRDLIRFACTQNAISFVVAHNHPSGDPRPSRQDIEITKQITCLGQLTQIPLMDHLIIAKNNYFSFADCGLIARFSQMKSLRLRK